MTETKTVSMITMQKLAAPSLIVLDPEDHSYFAINEDYAKPSDGDDGTDVKSLPLWEIKKEAIVRFLDDVVDGKIQVLELFANIHKYYNLNKISIVILYKRIPHLVEYDML